MTQYKTEIQRIEDRLTRIETALFFDNRFAIYPELKAARYNINQLNDDISTMRSQINKLEEEVFTSSWWNITNLVKSIPPTKWIVIILVTGILSLQFYQFMAQVITRAQLYEKYFIYFDRTKNIENFPPSLTEDQSQQIPNFNNPSETLKEAEWAFPLPPNFGDLYIAEKESLPNNI